MGEQRYRLCGDNSGHDYCVPIERVDEFYKRAEDDDDMLEDFMRIDGRFSFTDPQNI